MFILQMKLRHMTHGLVQRRSIYEQLPQGSGLMERSGRGPPLPTKSQLLQPYRRFLK